MLLVRPWIASCSPSISPRLLSSSPSISSTSANVFVAKSVRPDADSRSAFSRKIKQAADSVQTSNGGSINVHNLMTQIKKTKSLLRALRQVSSTSKTRISSSRETVATPKPLENQMSYQHLLHRQISMSSLAFEKLKKRQTQKSKAARLRVLNAELELLKAREAWLGFMRPRTEKSSIGKPPSKGSRAKARQLIAPPNSEVAVAITQKKDDTLPYSRRLEGVLEHKDVPVLEELIPFGTRQPIARLAHGLDRVLFNPNVHWFQDPHSKVYNFPHSIHKLPSISDFAFDRVTGFVTSSKDQELAALAKQHNKRFIGSTSSLSGLLSHIYYLISSHRKPDISTLTPPFHKISLGFSGGTKIPISLAFRKLSMAEGIYAADSLSNEDESAKNVLTVLGTVLEKYLTHAEDKFEMFLKNHKAPSEVDMRKEAYRYSKSSKFVMRSQLDCQDRRLPGTGVFDIKTRACIAIRVDRLNWVENSGYQIVKQHGLLESFEREYFDLIRSAFLKYQFQVRIGAMDGVFVAYHNTTKFFGFQYIPLEEMDQRLFGSQRCGDLVFEKCVGLLEVLADEIVNCYPNDSVSCLIETQEYRSSMNVWIRPFKEGSEVKAEVFDGPISLLSVTASNSISKVKVSSIKAIASESNEWSVHYTISHSSLDQAEIWASYRAAAERKNLATYLPTGVTAEEFLHTWRSLSYYSNNSEPGEEVFDNSDAEDSKSGNLQLSNKVFRPPHKAIKSLRALARKGRLLSEQADNTTGQKVVWNQSLRGGLEAGDDLGRFILQNTSSGPIAEDSAGDDANVLGRTAQTPTQ